MNRKFNSGTGSDIVDLTTIVRSEYILPDAEFKGATRQRWVSLGHERRKVMIMAGDIFGKGIVIRGQV